MLKHHQMINTNSRPVSPQLCPKITSWYQSFRYLNSWTTSGIQPWAWTSLPAWFLSIGAPVFAEELTTLFCRSLTEGVVPNQWKKAYIKTHSESTGPYCPGWLQANINHTNTIQIDGEACSPHVLLSGTQRPRHRFHLLISMPFTLRVPPLLLWLHYCNASQRCSVPIHSSFVIALDFSKAFDTVRHATLMEKLAKLDLPDHVYNWMASFFEGHSHCTIFADNVSLLAEIFASVIQGSGVGPISYIVCASDLHPLTLANKMFKFADDTCLVIPASHIHTRELELLNVENWATQNNLNLNRAQSQEIVFEKPRSRIKLTVPSLPGVARVDSLKILGVTLGSNFSLQDHITAVIASSGQALYALRILRSHGLGEADIQTVFRSIVQAKLLCASPAWWGFRQLGTERPPGVIPQEERQSRIPSARISHIQRAMRNIGRNTFPSCDVWSNSSLASTSPAKSHEDVQSADTEPSVSTPRQGGQSSPV